MKTVYLHIGTFKTGTTSIQRFLSRNRSSLAELGYFVPSSQDLPHHELPVSLIRDHSDFTGDWVVFEGNSYDIWEKLVFEIGSTTCNNIIISAEGFCDLVNEKCRDVSMVMGNRIKDYLKPFNVVVVCYLREILPYMRSIYGESIKSSTRTLSLETEISRFVRNRSIHLYPSIYLDFYAQLFGEKNLIVKQYCREKLVNHDVVQDFLSTVGLNLEVTSFFQKDHATMQQENTSIKPESIDVKRAFNLADAQGLSFNRKISEMLIQSASIASERSGGMSEIPGNGLVDIIDTEQEKLNKRYGLDFKPTTAEIVLESTEKRNGDYLFMLSLLAYNLKLTEEILTKLDALILQNQKQPILKRFFKIPEKIRRLLH